MDPLVSLFGPAYALGSILLGDGTVRPPSGQRKLVGRMQIISRIRQMEKEDISADL